MFRQEIDDSELVLRFIDFPIMTFAMCQAKHGSRMEANMICTDTAEVRLTCFMDSGSPLTTFISGAQRIVGGEKSFNKMKFQILKN